MEKLVEDLMYLVNNNKWKIIIWRIYGENFKILKLMKMI